jgi:hypothetical protein
MRDLGKLGSINCQMALHIPGISLRVLLIFVVNTHWWKSTNFYLGYVLSSKGHLTDYVSSLKTDSNTTVVEQLPRHPKGKGSSPTTASGNWRDKMTIKYQSQKLNEIVFYFQLKNLLLLFCQNLQLYCNLKDAMTIGQLTIGQMIIGQKANGSTENAWACLKVLIKAHTTFGWHDTTCIKILV